MVQSTHEPRWWQRAIQWIAATRVGAELFSNTTHHLDRVLMRITDGRVSTSRVLAGLPTVMLTTIGAKTGKERTVPVMGMPDGDEWIVVASNWGGEAHPAWYHNLQANPEAELSHLGDTQRYVAREATGDEYDDYWNRASRLYIGFDPYRRRSSGREIPIMVLSPVED